MRVRDILAALCRRWYLTVAVFGIAAAFAAALVEDAGSYTTRTVVAFTQPGGTLLSVTGGVADPSVIAFANAVVYRVNSGRDADLFSEGGAPLYGVGVRHGTLVSLDNQGNQWVAQAGKAEVQIQVVGSSRPWVRAQQQRLLGEVTALASQLQEAIAPDRRIQATVVPLTLSIEHVTPSRLTQGAAVAAIGAAALMIASWGAITLERMRRRTRARPRRTGRVPRPSAGRTGAVAT